MTSSGFSFVGSKNGLTLSTYIVVDPIPTDFNRFAAGNILGSYNSLFLPI